MCEEQLNQFIDAIDTIEQKMIEEYSE